MWVPGSEVGGGRDRPLVPDRGLRAPPPSGAGGGPLDAHEGLGPCPPTPRKTWLLLSRAPRKEPRLLKSECHFESDPKSPVGDREDNDNISLHPPPHPPSRSTLGPGPVPRMARQPQRENLRPTPTHARLEKFPGLVRGRT